jgi:hypothetical protein
MLRLLLGAAVADGRSLMVAVVMEEEVLSVSTKKDMEENAMVLVMIKGLSSMENLMVLIEVTLVVAISTREIGWYTGWHQFGHLISQ